MDSDATKKIIREWALENKHAFFSKLVSVVAGRPRSRMSTSEVASGWHSVAFCNYVPRYVAIESRVPLSNDDFALGAKALPGLIDRLQAKVVLVCGYRLWWWLLKGEAASAAVDPSQVHRLQIGPAIAARMVHPLAASSWPPWRPMVEELLEAAAQQRTLFPGWIHLAHSIVATRLGATGKSSRMSLAPAE